MRAIFQKSEFLFKNLCAKSLLKKKKESAMSGIQRVRK